MLRIAPPWVLFADALHAGGPSAPGVKDPHLAPGVHLRVMPRISLGLPSTPIFVSRFRIRNPAHSPLANHTEIRWVDDARKPLTAPFVLDPDRPVTGWLPSPSNCLWIEVFLDFLIEDDGGIDIPETPPVQVEALVSTSNCDRRVSRRSSPPYALCGTRIDKVVIRPNGATNVQVLGVRWIAADERLKRQLVPWDEWSLPVAKAPRYTPLETAMADANNRVLIGSPPHRPLHIDPVEGGPSASPKTNAGEETARVAKLTPRLAPRLDTLLTDLSKPPEALSEDLPADFGGAALQSKSAFPILGHVLQAALDPGVARWLGLAGIDRLSGVKPYYGNELFVYFARALWPARKLGQFAPVLGLTVTPGPALLKEFPELAVLGTLPTEPKQFFDLGVFMCAMTGLPPDRPDPLLFSGAEDLGWRSDRPPPSDRHAVSLSLGGVGPVAALAFAVRDQADSGPPTDRPLNPRLGPNGILREGEPGFDTALPLPLAVAKDDASPCSDEGRLQDRDGREKGGDYRIAQADWFGRWSEWVHASVGPWQRPRPPQPTLDLGYLPPSVEPDAPGSQSGTFTLTVSVPRPEDLPAGGRPLESFKLSKTVDGVPAADVTFPADGSGDAKLDPPPGPDAPGVLRIQVTGPALAPAGSAQVVFLGRWLDNGGAEQQESEPSLPVSRKIVDPRPLPPPVLPVSLLYSRRPDARGQARFELPFPASSPSCRIYYTTEATALRGLELRKNEPGAPIADLDKALDEIKQAGAGAPRAQAFGKWKQLLTASMFENLTTAPFSPEQNGRLFPHALSASLEGLALYRVQSVSATGVLSPFDKAPLVTAMVPNFGPPPRPLVTAGKEDSASGDPVVQLQVRVPVGNFAPIKFRARRSTIRYEDVRQMSVTNAGALDSAGGWLGAPASTDAQGNTTFVLADPGPFIPWRQYFWALEVQAGTPPGAPTDGSPVPAGEWSPASAVVSVDMVPLQPPGAPDAVTAVRNGSDVVVTITASGRAAVSGTPLGAFQVQVFRVVPGSGLRPERLTGAVVRTSPTELTVTDTGPPQGVLYTVRIVDPLGRAGDPQSTSSPV
jgi:hypothetical protein